MAWQIVGILLCGAGLLCLYRSWQLKARSWPLVLGGWAFILSSIGAWAQSSGIDKGPALGIAAMVLMALAALFVAALQTPVKQRRKIGDRVMPPGKAQESGRAWRTAGKISAIIVAGVVISIAVCTALFMMNKADGVEHTSNLTVTMFLFPILWAGLAVFFGYGGGARNKVATGLALIGISTAALLATI